MAKKISKKSIAHEIKALKKQFESIKKDTEKFVTQAKALKTKGIDDAQEVIESAKANWQQIVTQFESSPVAKFFAKKPAKKTAKKKTAKKKTAKKAAVKTASAS